MPAALLVAPFAHVVPGSADAHVGVFLIVAARWAHGASPRCDGGMVDFVALRLPLLFPRRGRGLVPMRPAHVVLAADAEKNPLRHDARGHGPADLVPFDEGVDLVLNARPADAAVLTFDEVDVGVIARCRPFAAVVAGSKLSCFHSPSFPSASGARRAGSVTSQSIRSICTS